MLKSSTLSRRAILHARAGLGPAVAVAAMLSLTAAAHSHSSTPHPFKSASIQWDPGGGGRPAPPSLLVGHDGEDYTHLVGEVSTRFRLKAKVKSGHRIYGFGITTGDPDMADNIPDDLMGFKRGTYKKSLDWHATFAMDAAKAVTTGTPGIALNRVEEIVDMCNSAFNVPPPTDRPAGSIELTVHGVFSRGDWKGATFASWTGWYPDGATSRPAYAHTTFPVNVICLNRSDPRVAELTPKPISVDIRVKQKGETCPKDTEVTAYIDYDRPATARFRIIHNGVEPKSAPIEIKARKVTFAGKTWYRVERLERYKLDPGKHTFQIKVLGEKPQQASKSPKKTIRVKCPPFKATSMWLTVNQQKKPTCPKKVDVSIRVNGNRPGSVLTKLKNQAGVVMALEGIKVKREGDQYVGRYETQFNMSKIDTMLIAEDSNDSATNSGWQMLKIECLEAQSGTLDLRGFKASRCEGEAAFSIRTNMPGKVPYQLDCTGGRSWSGKVQAHKTGPNTYIGVGVKRFDVSNNEQVNCALKTARPLSYKVLALRGRKYECHKPTDVGGADGFVPETRPDPQGPRNPGKVIVIPPRVVVDPVRPDRGGKRTDTTPVYPGKTRVDPEADKKRLELLRRKQALEAQKDAERKRREAAEAKRKHEAAKKAAEARRKREAAKKAAEARRKREAAKKATELRRKRAAAKKATEVKRRREAAKRAAAAKKAAEIRRKRKAAPPRNNRSRSQRRR